MLDKVHHARQSKTLLVDLDSTQSDTYGKQEQSAYNAHYGTVGFHPLVAFDGFTGDFLKAQLRPGNVYTSNSVVDFMLPLIEHYTRNFPETTALVRDDSGFAVPAFYDLCEKESVFLNYLFKIKRKIKKPHGRITSNR